MVSVVIPAYNRGFCITECLENILAQTYQDFEIIVVDDCSTDDTQERIMAFGSTKIRYIRNPFNQGAAGARNTGAAAAKGEYIAFQDSDDLWMPDKLRLQMAHLEETGSDMSFCQFAWGDIPYINESARKAIQLFQPHLFATLLTEPLITTQSILCKRSCFEALGGFDATLRCFEDYDFTLRFAEKYTISYLDTCLVAARRLDAGVNSNQTEKFKTQCMIFARYYSQIAAYGILIRWIDKLALIGRQCSPELQAEQFAIIRDLMRARS